jgi:hypothetical protein
VAELTGFPVRTLQAMAKAARSPERLIFYGFCAPESVAKAVGLETVTLPIIEIKCL